MRVISKAVLVEFWIRHPAAKQSLQTWFEDATHAQWKTPQDIKLRYSSASFVATNRVVFNIKGNDYRLVVKINYPYRVVYIRFVGTHAEYDGIDAEEV